MPTHQPPHQPFDLIVWDCDGTLSALEGVVHLAAQKGQKAKVAALTENAMQHGVMDESLFHARLDLIRPNWQDMQDLVDVYDANRTPYIAEVCQLLMQLGKTLWVASAGFQPSVGGFAERLGMPADNVHALQLTFDNDGAFVSMPPHQPFCKVDGKSTLLHTARQDFQRIAMIGDGANDFACAAAADRFVGFGGHYRRPNLRAHCQHYVEHADACLFLPLLLTEAEALTLQKPQKILYDRGLNKIQQAHAVYFNPAWTPMPH